VARLDESLGFAAEVSHAAVHGLCRKCRAADPAEPPRAGDHPASDVPLSAHPESPKATP